MIRIIESKKIVEGLTSVQFEIVPETPRSFVRITKSEHIAKGLVSASYEIVPDPTSKSKEVR